MRHASFFSGVGGLDLGFERAGIQTVSVCEIDPYASAVLAERFPDAPNLGSITEVEADDVPEADIYSGGFPCQDLSVAGKRAGFDGKRSSLAFTYLTLVEQRRPRWVVLENVPGLLSSNGGRDLLRLLSELDGIGYSTAWRTLDARYFGVAQRRRRVFLIASLEPDRAAEVLFECEGCERHIEASQQTRQSAASSAADGSGVASSLRAAAAKRGERGDGSNNLVAGALTRRFSKGVNSTIDEPLIVSPAADSSGVRAANGLARRLDDQQQVEDAQRVGCFEMYDFPADSVAPSMNALRARDLMTYANDSAPTKLDQHRSLTGGGSDSPQSERIWSETGTAPTLDTGRAVPQVFRKSARVSAPGSPETWVDDGLANTLNNFDVGDIRTTHAVLGGDEVDDPLLPLGLDGHRYRCCGNGVVSSVAEWIGRRIVKVDRKYEGGAR